MQQNGSRLEAQLMTAPDGVMIDAIRNVDDFLRQEAAEEPAPVVT